MNDINGQSLNAEPDRAASRTSFVTEDEEHLLICARAGDPTAFANLVMPHRDGILRLSQRLSRIALNAAFMRLRSSRRRTETSLDEIRRHDNAARFEVIEARPTPEQECALKEVRVLLAMAFDRLGPLYSEVIYMFHVQELSAKEAAQILNEPVGTVKARLHRARSRMGRHM